MAMKRRLFVENSSYGNQRFTFSATTGDYYRAAFKILLAFLAFLVGSIVTVGIGLLPFYLLLRAYSEVVLARLSWRNTKLADIRFDCGWTTGGLFKLYFANALGVVLSLGLLIPWAAIRTALQAGADHAAIGAGLGTILARRQEDVGAVGEAGELLGFDFGL
jgi:uncharacterized membrane protein YjgN (DUF898 family)